MLKAQDAGSKHQVIPILPNDDVRDLAKKLTYWFSNSSLTTRFAPGTLTKTAWEHEIFGSQSLVPMEEVSEWIATHVQHQPMSRTAPDAALHSQQSRSQFLITTSAKKALAQSWRSLETATHASISEMRRFTRRWDKSGKADLFSAVRAFVACEVGLLQVPFNPMSDQFNRVKEMVERSQDDKQLITLDVEQVVRVDNTPLREKFESHCAGLNLAQPNRKLLLHGTPPGSLQAIIAGGFLLRSHTSWSPKWMQDQQMFGDGIYFTSVSSKAAQYCGGKLDNDGRTVQLLACEVELGDQLLLQEKNLELNYETIRHMGKHSVHGVEDFNALRNPEDAVYHQHQAYPSYVVVCRQERKPEAAKEQIRLQLLLAKRSVEYSKMENAEPIDG